MLNWARGAYGISIVDPAQGRIVRQHSLDRFPADYAIAPNGKVYVPLHQDPGDQEVYLAILDRKTGQLSKRPYSGWTPHSITITPDGTAFILTGMTSKADGQIVVVMDTDQCGGGLFSTAHAGRRAQPPGPGAHDPQPWLSLQLCSNI